LNKTSRKYLDKAEKIGNTTAEKSIERRKERADRIYREPWEDL
jgi:hypothetical protein